MHTFLFLNDNSVKCNFDKPCNNRPLWPTETLEEHHAEPSGLRIL